MPTKDSTIRLKLVGARDVTTGLQALSKQMMSDFQNVQRASKVQSEAFAPGSAATEAQRKEASRKVIDANRRLNDTLLAAEDAKNKSIFDIQRKEIDKRLEYDLQATRRVTQKLITEGKIDLATANKAEEVLYTQEANEKAKILEKERAGVVKSAQQANKELTKQQDEFAKRESKKIQEGMQNRARAEERATKERAKADDISEKRSKMEYVRSWKSKIAEVEKRNKEEQKIQQFYDSEKIKNAQAANKALTQGADRARQQELASLRKNIEDRYKVATPPRKPGQQEMNGALSGFGGKMVLGGTFGQVAGKILGSEEANSMIGNVSSAFMFGGKGVGGAVAALQVIALSYETYVNRAKEATKNSIEFTNALVDLESTWSRLGTSLIERNPFGKTMDSMVKDFNSQRVKTSSKIAEQIMTDPELGDLITGGSVQKGRIKLSMDMLKLVNRQSSEARKFREKEYEIQIKDSRKILSLNENLTSLEAMRGGLAKERMRHEKQANIALEEQNALFESQTRQAKSSTTQAFSLMAELSGQRSKAKNALDSSNTVTRPAAQAAFIQADQAYQAAIQEYEDSVLAKNNLPQQQEIEHKKLRDSIRRQRLIDDENMFRAEIDITRKTEDQKIAIEKAGYAREVEMQRTRAFRLVKDAMASNTLVSETLELQRQMNLLLEEEGKRRKENLLKIVDQKSSIEVLKRDMEDLRAIPGITENEVQAASISEYTLGIEKEKINLRLANLKITREEAEFLKAKESMPGYELTEDGRRKLQAMSEMYNSQFETRIANTKKELGIQREQNQAQIDYINGQITRLEMEKRIAKLGLTAKEAKAIGKEIDSVVETARKRSLAEQFMSPLDRWRKERDAILEAKREGMITDERARHLLQVGVNSLQNLPVGQFSNMASRWQQVQSGVLWREDDTQKLLLEEFKGLRDDIDKLRTQGIMIKG